MQEAVEKIDAFVSVVAVLDDHDGIVAEFADELHAVLARACTDYEILFVDRLGLERTAAAVEPLLKRIPGMRFLRLVGSVAPDVAWAAAMENAIGDFVVLMSPDHDPPAILPAAIQKCRGGSDVVVGVAEAAYGSGYRVLSNLFHLALARWVQYRVPQGATLFRVLSRRAVNAVTRTGRFRHAFFVRVSSTGYATDTFAYRTIARRGRSRRKTVAAGFREAVNTMVFNTTAPLRLMSAMGILGSLLSLLYALYSILIRLWKSNVVEGWTSLSLVISVLFFILFTMMFFFGEYLSRLLDDQSEQDDYDVVFEKHSSVMIDEQRYNVQSESVADTSRTQTGRDR